jgi:UBX domain-containing protein 1
VIINQNVSDLINKQFFFSFFRTNPASRPYILQTTFPVKELKDDNQTVKEAGLLNSVIVQRYQ